MFLDLLVFLHLSLISFLITLGLIKICKYNPKNLKKSHLKLVEKDDD